MSTHTEQIYLDDRWHPIRRKTVWFIYRITDGEKSYIGITCRSLEQRWRAHLAVYRRAWPRSALYEAMRSKGPAAFTMTVISEALSSYEAGHKEARLIREMNTLYPHGFNLLARGGNAHERGYATRGPGRYER